MTADTMLTVEIVFLSPIPKCSKNFLLCSVLGHYNKPNKSQVTKLASLVTCLQNFVQRVYRLFKAPINRDLKRLQNKDRGTILYLLSFLPSDTK